MKEKKLSKYEQGLRDGAAPMEEKYRVLSSQCEGVIHNIREHTETQDLINSIMWGENGQDYAKLCNAIKCEKTKFEAAEMQYQNYDINNSFSIFHNLHHVPSSYYYLGEIYYNGYGDLPKDISKSCDCYKCGYELGDHLCSIKLAEYFPTCLPENVLPENIFNKHIPQITNIANSTTLTNSIIEYELGLIYEMGFGVNIDQTKAFKYYERSADKKFFKALHSVYRCYLNGIGTEKDEKKALSYLNECQRIGYKTNV